MSTDPLLLALQRDAVLSFLTDEDRDFITQSNQKDQLTVDEVSGGVYF
jgi:hypothetical protein